MDQQSESVPRHRHASAHTARSTQSQPSDGSATALTRPAPLEPVLDRFNAWLSWIGLGRLALGAFSTVVVCVGAYWLVRSPPPPAEATLPYASAPSLASTPDANDTIPASATDGPPTTEPAGPAVVVVHVAGAVQRPGVYELSGDSRVNDAIMAAGGSTDQADPNVLNLAAELADGARVYVPEIGEEVPDQHWGANEVRDSGLGNDSAGLSSVPDGPIDVNRADVALLDTLPGVGPATAAAIVTERERNGPFLGVDDLERVPGIGPAKVAALRDLVTA